MTHSNLEWSITQAEIHLAIFERLYAEDKRPRLAVEATKNCLSNPTAENKERCRSAADAALDAAAAAALDAAAATDAAADAAVTAVAVIVAADAARTAADVAAAVAEDN